MARRPTPIVTTSAAAASWSKNNPTPPLAPSTSSRLAAGRPSRDNTTSAVPAASGVAAPPANETAGPIGRAGLDAGKPGVPAGAVREVRHRHHPVAGHQAADPAAHAVDDPGHVIAEDARHVQPGPAAVRPVAGVDRVDPGRVHGDPRLAR